MDRREFLQGLFGVATVMAMPSLALSKPASLDWQAAVLEVYNKCQFDLMMFGQCYSKYTDEFPYIKHIPLNEIYND